MKNILLAFILILFIGCKDKKEEDLDLEIKASKQEKIANQEEAVLTQNIDAPFSLNFTDGTILSMKKTNEGYEIDNGNSPIMFIFLTTWCPPCLAQIPVINTLNDKYKEYFQINLIILDEDKNESIINNFIKNSDIKYKVVADDSSEAFTRSFGGISGVPYILLYNSKGEKIKEYSGLIPGEMLDIDIQKVIQQ